MEICGLNNEENKAIEYFNTETTTEAMHYGAVLVKLIEKQSKEIEELKEERKSYTEEYIHNNPWLYKQLNENYILRVESEQKEKQAYIDGTNVADKLCNEKWEDKIKAKIEEIDKDENTSIPDFMEYAKEYAKGKLQSLLEKE